MDDFDHILKQFLGKLPEHSPKPDVWNKISGKLDEDLAMSRLRRILKNTERTPKKDLWPAIESVLVAPILWKAVLRSVWVKYVLPSVFVVTTLVFVNPFSNARHELAYNKPLQRNANAEKIVSDKNNLSANARGATLINPVFPSQNAEKSNAVNDHVMNNLPENQVAATVLPDAKDKVLQLSENIMDGGNKVASSQNNSNEDIPFENLNVYPVTPLSLLMLEDKQATKNPLIEKLTAGNSLNVPADKGLGHANFSLEYSYAPEVSFMQLKNNNDDYTIDLEKRKQAEQLSYSSTTGLEGKVDFRHWFFQSGVNYSQITTSSEYRFSYSGIDTVGWHLDTAFIYIWVDTLGYYHDSLMYQWSPVVDNVSYENKKYPSYQLRYLQIPLLAGYSVTRGKMQYAVSAGVSLGIPLSVTGRMIETDNYTISDVEKQPLSLRKIVYNGLLRMGVNYFISPHYSVFAQPSLRYTLNPVFDKNYPVSQKYLTCGVRFGITYRF